MAVVSAHCGLWLDWAATQIEVSLARYGTECDRLLAALDGLVSASQLAVSDGSPAGETLEHRMSQVVVAIQSHDRLMQQLTHVVQSLRSLHEHLSNVASAVSDESWRLLGERQLRSFSMPEERALFARMIDASGEGALGRRVGADESSTVELFEDAVAAPPP
ncbi:MAG TPA: hypothetical protein VKT22_01255 [Steroidobacteraceae bacterium]|nr:hypothetical protein [Steroidobacteraceae bacterium]